MAATLIQTLFIVLWNRIRLICGLDVRSLALYRVLVGVVIIGDLIDRSFDITAHYTDIGLFPRWTAVRLFGPTTFFGLHYSTGSALGMSLLFILHGFIALLFIIGYHTRLVTIGLYIMHVSLNARNEFVTSGGDEYMGVLLYWSMFLPLGATFSVDKALSKSPQIHTKAQPTLVSGVAPLAIIIQISCMYFFSAIHKNGEEWTTQYTAAFYALQLDYFRLPVGALLLRFATLDTLKFICWAVWWWEFYGVFFLFAPIFTESSRLFGTLAFMVMHLGFGLCLSIGTFFWITFTALTILLPPVTWDVIIIPCARYFCAKGKLRVTFSPFCERCRIIARILDTFCTLSGTTEYVSAQAVDSHETRAFPKCHWTVQSNTTTAAQSDVAVVFTEVCAHSPLLWWLAKIFRRAPPLVSAVQWLLRNTLPLPPHQSILRKGQIRGKFREEGESARITWRKAVCWVWNGVLSIWLLACIVLILSWNLVEIDNTRPLEPLGVDVQLGFSELRPVIVALRLGQNWGMFAPRPPAFTWWYVLEGNLTDGSRVELFGEEGMFRWRGREFTWDKPASVAASIGNHRWFKWYEQMNDSEHRVDMRRDWKAFVCREWNRRHPDEGKQLVSLKLWWLFERVNLDSSREPPSEPLLLWDDQC